MTEKIFYTLAILAVAALFVSFTDLLTPQGTQPMFSGITDKCVIAKNVFESFDGDCVKSFEDDVSVTVCTKNGETVKYYHKERDYKKWIIDGEEIIYDLRDRECRAG